MFFSFSVKPQRFRLSKQSPRIGTHEDSRTVSTPKSSAEAAFSKRSPIKKFINLGLLLLITTPVWAKLPQIQLSIKDKVFQVEVAKSLEERETGLMNRKALASDQGMLFVYPQARNLSMWMKNTLLSLDMIFMDEHKRVIHIHARAQPYSLVKIPSLYPAKYVLEINAGKAAELDIHVGTQVKFSQE